MQLKGIIKKIFEVQQVTDKFAKCDFVLTDASSQYPQHILFQCTQDRIALLNNVNEGDEVTIYFNVRGREWTSPQGEVKYFLTLEAWKIERSVGAPTANTSAKTEYLSTDQLPF